MTALHGITAAPPSTGWRDLTALAPAAWLAEETSYLHLERTGPFCTLTLFNIKSDSGELYMPYAGFAPPFTRYFAFPSSGTGFLSGYQLRVMGAYDGPRRWNARIRLRWYYPQSSVVSHQVTWRVDPRAADMPDPTNLPGTQVTPPNY